MEPVTGSPRESSTEPARLAALDRCSPTDVADLLLMALVVRGAGTLVVEPDGGRHALRYERGESVHSFASLDSALADAVVARLAIIAGLVVGATESQLGRLRVRLGAGPKTGPRPATDLLLAIRTTPEGLVAEIHRIGMEDAAESFHPPTDDSPLDLATEPLWVGRYRIVSELGRGGMGIVYRAEHVALQKPVAIKVLNADAAENPIMTAQFMVEARAACRARHPGIVDVTDFGTLADGRAFIVMELVEGETLVAQLKRSGPLAPSVVVALTHEIASALRAAAAQGVVHRDLTPANIFVDRSGRVKIGDFGLARIIDPVAPPPSLSANTSIIGTATYMSPEQGRCESADVRSDIYSLGCVMFRMLTGRVPYSGTTLIELVAQHASSPIPAVEGPAGPVPDRVAHIVRRAMAKRREERYQHVEEMLADLEHAERALARDDWRKWLPT
jgi:tRNA A-37 threonylcarbamoyl transferase component Bud32